MRNNLLSSWGRLVLVNSSPSNQPIYTMGFYSLNGDTHKKMDTIRSRFFWRGASDKLKYHMVKQKAVCRPKIFEGLGVINTRIMYACLMTKWFWRIDMARDELWFGILKAKYFIRGAMREAVTIKCSQFWKSLQRLKHLFK